MLTASSMEFLSLVVLKEKAEDVASLLLKLAVFHPIDIRAVEQGLNNLSSIQIEREYGQLDNYQIKVREIVRKLHLEIEAIKQVQTMDIPQIDDILKVIEERMSPLVSAKEELREKIKTNQVILAQVKEFVPFPIRQNGAYTFLDVSVGNIEEKSLPVFERSLTDIPHVIYPIKKSGNKLSAILIGLRKDRMAIKKVLADLKWQDEEAPKDSDILSKEAQQKVTQEIKALNEQVDLVDKDMAALAMQYKEVLSKINSFITLKKSLLDARRFSCTTEKTAIFSGWVPKEEKENFVQGLKRVSEVLYIESMDPEELNIPKEEIPVRLRHTPILKPFELLIDSYGIPRYGTVDPTVFVAISFLIMFGGMFGDLGHGLVLILAGFFLAASKKEKIKQAGSLLRYCGVSSSIFGFLYGSFFGFEFDSLWSKPMDDITGIFRLSIILGVVMITLGIMLNIINSIRDKNYSKALFDKAGLIGGIVYWSAVAAVTKTFIVRTKVPFIFSHLIFWGLAVLFLYPVLEHFLKKKKESLFESFMESMVGILEIIMGYLANTVSFIRVGAFALAHAGLFIAIFQLSEMNKEVGYGLVAWTIIVLGNILVVCLEGLVVSIQSIRLNYYEFFSKFFISGKSVYKPLSV